MGKKIIVFVILVIAVLFLIAPFTFRDQINNFLSLFSNGSDQDDQTDSRPELNLVDNNVLRIFDEELCFSFITPADPSVINLKNEILQDQLTLLTPDWMALRDWVGNKIQYVSDSEVHGEREFWQFSNETIFLETGDCEDFSILLCSLLRSNGWATDSVYVVVGERNNMYHAWVRLVWNDMQYNIEPQGSGFDVLIGDITNLSGFEAICYFNDQEFGSF